MRSWELEDVARLAPAQSPLPPSSLDLLPNVERALVLSAMEAFLTALKMTLNPSTIVGHYVET